MDKLDFKKQYKDLYLPGQVPSLVNVPAMRFLAVDGCGDPNNESYAKAVEALYAVAYTIKMSKMGDWRPDGYVEYVVPPLEGLWWCEGGTFSFEERDNWRWRSLIRQPEFVTPQVLDRALGECGRKKPETDVSSVRLLDFTEGLCVQMMHIGPYATEPETMTKIREFISENRLTDLVGQGGLHHELYLSDPRKTAPDKLKTVLRHPVRPEQ